MLGHSAPKRPSDGNPGEHFKLKRPKDDALLPPNSGRNTPEGVFSSHYADLNKISQLEIGHTPETNLRDRSPSGVDENICYGMICDITAQVCSVPDHQGLPLRQTGTSESNLVSFSLNILKDCGEIVSEDGKPIAQLNTKTHTILQHVSAEMKIAFTALFTAETITMKLSEATTHTRMKPGDVKCTVDILICGSRGVAKDVASRLGKYRLFLQHPYPHVTDLAYENPQYLHIDGASLLMGSILPPLSIEVMEAGDDNSDLGGIGVAKNGQPDPWSVLDELSAPENLPQVEADERITTELLRHQKEGIAFITSRENPESFNLNTLWKLDFGSSAAENIRYRHRITGAIRSSPENFCGGLLADDMGLGKTLMMIASIVATSRAADAHTFPQTSQRDLDPSVGGPIPVKSTLILVPSLLLVDTWIKQLEQHVRPGTLSVYKYHGQQRRLDASSPLPYDVVVSTYATVASDHNRGGGMLSRFSWFRLILDEAHVIRNWSTKQFNAVNSLSTNIRWCMTGTPIQNTIDDLGSLIKFLRVPQFSDTLVFRKHISGMKKIGQSYAKLNVANLRLLLSSMCLRRKQSVISLPGVTEVKHEVQFSERELSAHKAILIACKKSAMASANQPNEKKSAKATLQGILRMRMFCNVGFEVGGSSVGEMSEPDQVLSLLQQSGDAKCYSCAADIHDLSENARISHCYSAVCGECAPDLQSEAAQRGADRNCPMCKKKCDGNIFLDSSATQESCRQDELPLPSLGRVWPSKLLAVLQDLKENLEKEKSIVFSFWRQSLDVVGRLLAEHNIAYCRVDGVLKPAHREKVLEDFCSDGSLRVLLMTLGTGAVGLNDLSIASRVHFLEPQWNPSIESQAIGRVLRLGQEKEVCIVRYIVKGSIEKSVEDRQITKIRLAQAGEMHSAESFSEAGLALISEQLDQIGEK